jgi:tellurite resistance protein
MSYLPYVPASYFGIVLGTIGLGGCWRQARIIWNAPVAIGETLMALGAVIWAVLLAGYAANWIWRRKQALEELQDPVRCCFAGLVPVSTMLVSVAAVPYGRPIAAGLALPGAVGQVLFAVYRTGQLWTGGRDPESTTPVLYLPSVAGNFVSAIVAVAFDLPDVGMYLFGAGLLSWLGLESVILHRLYVHAPLPASLRPTLGIQIAPALVGCSAYLSLTSGPPDMIAKGLLGYGIVQVLIVARMLSWIGAQPFGISYWAFTFGLTAMAADAMKFVQRGVDGFTPPFAYFSFAIANISVAAIAVGTVLPLLRGGRAMRRLGAVSTNIILSRQEPGEA